MKLNVPKLKKILLQRDLSLENLACMAELSISTINRAMKGECSQATAYHICNALDIKIAEITEDNTISETPINIIRYMSCCAYLSPTSLAQFLNLSTSTIMARRKEIEKFSERYYNTAIIKDGGVVLLNMLAFLDYLKYRDMLLNAVTRSYVPDFDPYKWAHAMGWYGDNLTYDTKED